MALFVERLLTRRSHRFWRSRFRIRLSHRARHVLRQNIGPLCQASRREQIGLPQIESLADERPRAQHIVALAGIQLTLANSR